MLRMAIASRMHAYGIGMMDHLGDGATCGGDDAERARRARDVRQKHGGWERQRGGHLRQ